MLLYVHHFSVYFHNIYTNLQVNRIFIVICYQENFSNVTPACFMPQQELAVKLQKKVCFISSTFSHSSVQIKFTFYFKLTKRDWFDDRLTVVG